MTKKKKRERERGQVFLSSSQGKKKTERERERGQVFFFSFSLFQRGLTSKMEIKKIFFKKDINVKIYLIFFMEKDIFTFGLVKYIMIIN